MEQKKDKTSTLKFTNARLMAIQAIYMAEFTDEHVDAVTSRFLMGDVGGEVILETEKGREEFIDIHEADVKLFTKIMREYATRKESIDETIKMSLSPDIPFDRLEWVLKSVLRAGIAEFYANPKLDAPIIINEYTDIARSFYEGPEVKMVNAILDRFGKVMKNQF